MTDNKMKTNEKGKIKIEELKEKVKTFCGKFKNVGKFLVKNKKNLIVCTSVLVICGAVYLNYSLFHKPQDASAGADSSTGDTNTLSAAEEYFSSAALSRQKARDEAMQVLQQVIDSSDAVEQVKSDAYTSINTIAQQIECESNIEQLIMAKGFQQCLAVVNENSASVIVKSDGLLANEVAQIKEIVYEQSGIHPKDIKIIEKS